MKRIIMMLCVLLPVIAFSQSNFSVYKSAENVILYNDDNLHHPVKKGDVLKESDLIEVPVKNGIHILEKGTNRIYTNVKAGKQTVGAIVTKSTKDANSTFANLNRQIVKNISKNNQGKGYSTYGMTTRGQSEELTYADSLYYAIYSIIQDIKSVEYLSPETNSYDDGTVSFIIENNGENDVYISLVYGNSSHLSICLEGFAECSSIPLPSDSRLDLTSLRFVEPLPGEGYYVVASEKEFDLSPIKTMLRYMREPDFSADPELISMSIIEK